MKFTSKNTLIWDWNGTLLDDADYCVKNMNILLKRRNLPLINKSIYREIFTFPVINYYKKAGIDLKTEGFEKPAQEFINLYFGNFHNTYLFPCAAEILKKFQNKGLKQVVLSAMEHNSLQKTLKEKSIFQYFDHVTGIGDHYGGTKTDIGLQLMKKLSAIPEQIVMIGDTLHDKEVADAMGIDIILVSQGHYSLKRLQSAKVPIINKLDELLTMF